MHVRGALNNGASEVEIRETLLQAACYCGMPAGIEGFKVAERVLVEWKSERGVEGEWMGEGAGEEKRRREDEERHQDVGLQERVDMGSL